jgi:hypothetical protein
MPKELADTLFVHRSATPGIIQRLIQQTTDFNTALPRSIVGATAEFRFDYN